MVSLAVLLAFSASDNSAQMSHGASLAAIILVRNATSLCCCLSRLQAADALKVDNNNALPLFSHKEPVSVAVSCLSL